jgi:hypothetical protein
MSFDTNQSKFIFNFQIFSNFITNFLKNKGLLEAAARFNINREESLLLINSSNSNLKNSFPTNLAVLKQDCLTSSIALLKFSKIKLK